MTDVTIVSQEELNYCADFTKRLGEAQDKLQWKAYWCVFCFDETCGSTWESAWVDD